MHLISSRAHAQDRPDERQRRGASAHVYQEDGRTVVCVHGEIDLGTVDALEHALAVAANGAAADVVVDLGKAPFIETTGLRALTTARDRLSAHGGSLLVRNGGRLVQRFFAIAGADGLLEPQRPA